MINTQLVGYGLRQTSQRLAGSRARQYQAAYERTGAEAYRDVAGGLFAKAGETGGATGAGGAGAGVRPEFPDIPTFKAPEYDESKVAAKTQKIAAPKVRQLREAVRAVQAQPFENPNVKRMTVSQALQGYGTGLEGVMAGARRGAVAEYGQEYGKEFTEAQMNFQAQLTATMAEYGNLWNEYLMQFKSDLSTQDQGGGIRQDPGYKPPTSLADTPWTVGTFK